MHSNAFVMKLHTYTSAAALLGLGLFTVSLALGFEPTGSFATWVAILLMLGFAHDYAPRKSRWEPGRRLATMPFPNRTQAMSRRPHDHRLAA